MPFFRLPHYKPIQTVSCHSNQTKEPIFIKAIQSLKVMNAPAICNSDFDLASTRLKCLLVLDIVTICVKFNQNQFTKQH